MTDPRLDQALSDERAGRFLESFRHCLEVLGDNPRNAGALALASRLSMLAGDAANAIAYACEAVRIDGEHPEAQQALNVARQARSGTSDAIAAYSLAVDIEPEIALHVIAPGALVPFARMDEAQHLLDESLKHDPGLAQAHAAAANLALRKSEYLGALAGYQRAAFISGRPEYALALSEVLFSLNQHTAADYYRDRALRKQRLYPARPSTDPTLKVLALMAPGPWSANAPLDFALDRQRVQLSRLYLTESVPPETLQPYDTVINAIGEAEAAQGAIAIARSLSAQTPKTIVNDPAHSWKTERTKLSAALANVAGCRVPQTRRVKRDALTLERSFPMVVRPVDSHGGRGAAKIESRTALAQYLKERPEQRFDVSPFVEYRSADGYYRKYRIAIVAGAPYAYHLAISAEWLVHYIGSETPSTPWMQQEEERFLSDPASVFANWSSVFPSIAQALGLDYFAIDCGLLSTGEVLIFEADIASLIHCREPAGSYKYRYVPQIFTALQGLLQTSAR